MPENSCLQQGVSFCSAAQVNKEKRNTTPFGVDEKPSILGCPGMNNNDNNNIYAFQLIVTGMNDTKFLACVGSATDYVMWLPGASVVPANMEPHMTVDAPRARALTMCPEFCTPPSAMMGTPAALATLPTWYTAVACPRPTAQT